MPFGTGAKLDRPDNRDHQWSEVGFGSSPFDWQSGYDVEQELATTLGLQVFKLPVKNQDGSFSCGGQAWAQQAGVLEGLFTKTFEERSARFVYSQTFVQGGGSAGRDNSNLFVKQGIAREAALSSYNANGSAPSEIFMENNSDITDAVRADALTARAYSYANVSTDIDTIAQAIRDNHGVIVGVVGQNNGTWNSPYPNLPTVGGVHWYHWIYAGKAKLINGAKFIGCLNSWGTAAGDQGWQWLPESYFSLQLPQDPFGKAVWQGWTHVYNANPAPIGFHHTFTAPLLLGRSGAEIKALQQALQIDGEFPMSVPCTGYYGNVTRTAVLAFQLKYQLDSKPVLYSLNGERVGAKTAAQLNKLFA